MVDASLYHALHPNKLAGDRDRRRSIGVTQANPNEDPPSNDFLLLLPATIHGYDMHAHYWTELLVSELYDVAWKKELFDQLVLPTDDKDLLHAMAISYTGRDQEKSEQGKRDVERCVLFQGGPGCGKSFAARAIAELTKRPLYYVSLSGIGTNLAEAQRYFKSIAHMCNAWNCVVVFDGADTFLKSRPSGNVSVSHNAMVMTILEALDSFRCMVILISNWSGTFDEMFHLRYQLAIFFQKPDQIDRERMWMGIIENLKQHCEEDGHTLLALKSSIQDFGGWDLNGHQIKQVVRMARRVACLRKENLSVQHMNLAYGSFYKLAGYLA